VSNHFLDGLGEMCPVPNIMVREKLKEIAVGEVIVIETDHSCARQTIQSEMKKLGHRVMIRKVAKGVWQLAIIKGRS